MKILLWSFYIKQFALSGVKAVCCYCCCCCCLQKASPAAELVSSTVFPVDGQWSPAPSPELHSITPGSAWNPHITIQDWKHLHMEKKTSPMSQKFFDLESEEYCRSVLGNIVSIDSSPDVTYRVLPVGHTSSLQVKMVHVIWWWRRQNNLYVIKEKHITNFLNRKQMWEKNTLVNLTWWDFTRINNWEVSLYWIK